MIEHGRRPDDGKPQKPVCLCGEPGKRDAAHDAYYCPPSGVWLEDPCDDPDCQFYPGRPEKKGWR